MTNRETRLRKLSQMEPESNRITLPDGRSVMNYEEFEPSLKGHVVFYNQFSIESVDDEPSVRPGVIQNGQLIPGDQGYFIWYGPGPGSTISRTGGPAIIFPNGTQVYCEPVKLDTTAYEVGDTIDKLKSSKEEDICGTSPPGSFFCTPYRANGPAIEYADGSQVFINEEHERSRKDGPAIVRPDSVEFWYNGIRYSSQQEVSRAVRVEQMVETQKENKRQITAHSKRLSPEVEKMNAQLAQIRNKRQEFKSWVESSELDGIVTSICNMANIPLPAAPPQQLETD